MNKKKMLESLYKLQETIIDLEDVNTALSMLQNNFNNDVIEIIGQTNNVVVYDSLSGIIKANEMLFDKLELTLDEVKKEMEIYNHEE